MVIYNLRPGRLAPEQADFAHVSASVEGVCSWIGSVGVGAGRVEGKSRKSYQSLGEATSDAINWARAHHSSDFYIEIDGDT